MPRPTGKVWKHFDYIENEVEIDGKKKLKANSTCKFCHTTKPYRNPGDLRVHLCAYSEGAGSVLACSNVPVNVRDEFRAVQAAAACEKMKENDRRYKETLLKDIKKLQEGGTFDGDLLVAQPAAGGGASLEAQTKSLPTTRGIKEAFAFQQQVYVYYDGAQQSFIVILKIVRC
jgi:hypothetical protein